MNGKKYAVIAVALFLVLGVGSAVFADYDGDEPVLEQTKGSNLGEPKEPTVTVDENIKNQVVPPVVDKDDDENTGTLVIPDGNGGATDNSVPVSKPSVSRPNNTNTNKPVVLPSEDNKKPEEVVKPDDNQNNGEETKPGNDSDVQQPQDKPEIPSGGNQGGTTTPSKPSIGGDTKPTEEQIIQNINKELEKIENLTKVEDVKDKLDEISKEIAKVTDEKKKKELENDLTVKLEKVLEDEISKAVESGNIEDVKEIRDILSERLDTITDEDERKEIKDNLDWLSKGIDGTPAVIADVQGKVSGNTNYTTQESVSVTIPNAEDGVTIKLNGKVVTEEDLKNITKEGAYSVDIIDKDGNVNTINFSIDRTAPTMTYKSLNLTKNEVSVSFSEILANMSFSNSVSISRHKTNVKRYNITFEELSQKDGLISSVILEDKAGNKAYYNIIKTKDVITCEPISTSEAMLMISKDLTNIINE